MWVTHFDTVRRRKAAKENRDIDTATIAREASLAINTVKKIKRGDLDGVKLETLAKLLAYFDLKSLADLVEWKPEGSQ